MKKLLSFAVCGLLISSSVLAQSNLSRPSKSGVGHNNYTGCDSTAPVLNPDGSTFEDYISTFGNNFVQVNLKKGHSYSTEVWDPWGQHTSGPVYLVLIRAGCSSNDSYTDVAGMDPDLTSGFSDRISWVQQSDSLEFIFISSYDTFAGHSYNLRIVDTTLHNPRWTTYGGFETSFGFMNTTNAAISGTLTMIDTAGSTYATNITIPAGSQVFKIASTTGGDINLGKGDAGFANFTFVGPAGAIVADAYYLNGSATVVVPSSFGPRNYQH